MTCERQKRSALNRYERQKKISITEIERRNVIGKRLEEVLEENRISQSELSKILLDEKNIELSQPSISCIIKGKRPLDEEIAEKIIELLPINSAVPRYRKMWLLGYDSEKYITKWELRA